MNNNRIEDNHSNKKFKKEFEGMEALQQLLELIPLDETGKEELEKLFSAIPGMKKEFELLSKSADRFNDHFSERGWIAHESMNSDLMLNSIELAEKGLHADAEERLIEHYTSEKLFLRIGQLRGIEAFSVRYNFFQLAHEDTIAGRFHSSIPLLLMMIDGAVNDIDKEKGFFAKDVDLEAWDSIAAHSTGLMKLKKIYNESRNTTSMEEISLPYRNGILHGRDLGYANRIVAAKCWATVFAVRDWALAVKQGKKNPPPPEKEESFEESLLDFKKTINEYDESKKRREAVNDKVSKWKARELTIGVDLPAKGEANMYEDYTPEKEAMKFLEYWFTGKFGKMVSQIRRFTKEVISVKTEAGRIRGIFEKKRLLDYKIIKIKDLSPALSDISIQASIEVEGVEYQKEINLRFTFEGDGGRILVFGDKEGQWKFRDDFFNEIEIIGL